MIFYLPDLLKLMNVISQGLVRAWRKKKSHVQVEGVLSGTVCYFQSRKHGQAQIHWFGKYSLPNLVGGTTKSHSKGLACVLLFHTYPF